MAPVTLQPTIQLSPFEKYKLALQAYQAQNPQLAGQYQAMGAPSGLGTAPQAAPGAGIGGPGLGLLAGRAIANQFGGGASATVGNVLGQGVANSTGTLAQQGASLGMKASGIPGASVTPVTPGIGVMPYVGAAGAALGAKGLYDSIQANDPKMGAISGAGMGLGLAAAAPLVGLGPVGWGAMGLMALGGGGLGGGLASLLGHKSTKERQADRWKGLLEQGKAPEWAFANGVNQDQGFGDRDLRAGIDPRKVWASSAMFDTFGKDWANTGTELQREEITRQILANKLIDTKQGVSYMLDKDKANQIKTNVLANLLAAPAVKPVIIPRSTTISPGIGKDGKRINYGAKK